VSEFNFSPRRQDHDSGTVLPMGPASEHFPISAIDFTHGRMKLLQWPGFLLQLLATA
jgi:hypothetical protein